MKEYIEYIPLSLSFPISSSSLFFDIETTGLSAKKNHIYLLGCACYQNNQMELHQFFSESSKEEQNILIAFSDFCQKFHTLITYNGTGFDLPFLKQRCEFWGLANPLAKFDHMDLLRLVSPFKKLLKLPDMRQKSLEVFLSIERDDLYSGKELIDIYHTYEASQDLRSLSLLLLHNKEDVLAMPRLFPILSYRDFFSGCFRAADVTISPYRDYSGEEAWELFFTLIPDTLFPRSFSCVLEELHLLGQDKSARLRVKVFQGELKYFYPNYQDYYYLPQEDTAIHKSVATYVDKEFRQKAKASKKNIKKSGRFLPQYKEYFTPCFKTAFHETPLYLELTDEFLASREIQKKYAMHLLSVLQPLP